MCAHLWWVSLPKRSNLHIALPFCALPSFAACTNAKVLNESSMRRRPPVSVLLRLTLWGSVGSMRSPMCSSMAAAISPNNETTTCLHALQVNPRGKSTIKRLMKQRSSFDSFSKLGNEANRRWAHPLMSGRSKKFRPTSQAWSTMAMEKKAMGMLLIKMISNMVVARSFWECFHAVAPQTKCWGTGMCSWSDTADCTRRLRAQRRPPDTSCDRGESAPESR